MIRGIKNASLEELNLIYGNIISSGEKRKIREVSPAIEKR